MSPLHRYLFCYRGGVLLLNASKHPVRFDRRIPNRTDWCRFQLARTTFVPVTIVGINFCMWQILCLKTAQGCARLLLDTHPGPERRLSVLFLIYIKCTTSRHARSTISTVPPMWIVARHLTGGHDPRLEPRSYVARYLILCPTLRDFSCSVLHCTQLITEVIFNSETYYLNFAELPTWVLLFTSANILSTFPRLFPLFVNFILDRPRTTIVFALPYFFYFKAIPWNILTDHDDNQSCNCHWLEGCSIPLPI